MKEPSVTPHDRDLWIFLEELKTCLRAVREEKNALKLSLRRTCDLFKVGDGCIATLTPDGSRAQLMSVIPRGGQVGSEPSFGISAEAASKHSAQRHYGASLPSRSFMGGSSPERTAQI